MLLPPRRADPQAAGLWHIECTERVHGTTRARARFNGTYRCAAYESEVLRVRHAGEQHVDLAHRKDALKAAEDDVLD